MAAINSTTYVQKRATLHEVARLAGVSHVTVARAFSDTTLVSDKTLKKVREAVKRLDYKPNLLARGLKGAATKSIAIVWPMGYMFIPEKSVAELITGLQQHGYSTQMGNTLNDIKMTKEMLNGLLQRSVDAVVINISPEILDDEIIDILKCFRAAVIISVQPLNINVDQIVWNRTSAIRDAVTYLISKGRKNIAHCGLLGSQNPAGRMPEQYKADAFLNCLSEHGLKSSYDNLLFFESTYDPYDIDFIRSMLEKSVFSKAVQFDAFLCVNDCVAIILSQMLQEHGFDIPKDIAIVGYDDREYSRLFNIPIATVNRQNESLVNAIQEVLFARLNDKDLPIQKKEVFMKFVCRASAG